MSSHEESGHTYVCIDLKSYYASVECVARGLDPLQACLLVADESRSDKTICLAVSPALKKLDGRVFLKRSRRSGNTSGKTAPDSPISLPCRGWRNTNGYPH